MQEARLVLIEAEASLRQLMERGLEEQRYADLAEIARLADVLSKLLRGPSTRVPGQSAGAPTGARPKTSKAKPKKSRRSALRSKRYPRFRREGNRLVKVGWSKKQKAEYEHRAPREAVVALARHLTGQVAEGQVFTVDEVLPVSDDSGGEVPAYQVYLVLAWLKHEGVVEKKGRDGYVLRDGSLMDGGLDRLWDGIPARGS